MGYPLQYSLVIESVPAAEPTLHETPFKTTTKNPLYVSILSYVHYNVSEMDLQGSTFVGKHLLFHMDLSHGDSNIKHEG